MFISSASKYVLLFLTFSFLTDADGDPMLRSMENEQGTGIQGELTENVDSGTSHRALTYYSYVQWHGYCRKDQFSTNPGLEGKEYSIYPNIQSLYWCKHTCTKDSNCKGFEFSPGRCEIWWVTPQSYSKDDKAKCYYKNYNYHPPTPKPHPPPTPKPHPLPTPKPHSPPTPRPHPAPTPKPHPPPTPPYETEKCEVVHRRPIYGTGDDPYKLDQKQNYLVSHYKPFEDAPKPYGDKYRKWKVYAVYYSPEYHNHHYYDIKVKFDMKYSNKDVVFDLPYIGDPDGKYRVAAYSDYYYEDKDYHYPYDKSADVKVYVETNGQYQYYGWFYWIELIAYDCY